MKFLNWLVYSSEDPSNFSLTLKGIAATVFPLQMWIFVKFALAVAEMSQFWLLLRNH